MTENDSFEVKFKQEFTQGGMISKTKDRRLLLLNDLLVCVAVNSKTGQEYRSSSSSERLTLKWAFPVAEIEVEILKKFISFKFDFKDSGFFQR